MLNEEYAFRAYMTEAAMIVTENTQRFAGGSRLGKHWSDVVEPRQRSMRSGDEIAAEIIARAGLTVVGGELDGT